MTNPRTAGVDVLLNAAAAALATRRLTTVVVEDEIAREVREGVWQKFPPETTKIGYLLTCRKCSSVWAGATVFALSRFRVTRWIVAALALSEVSLSLDVALNSANARLRTDNDSPAGFFD